MAPNSIGSRRGSLRALRDSNLVRTRSAPVASRGHLPGTRPVPAVAKCEWVATRCGSRGEGCVAVAPWLAPAAARGRSPAERSRWPGARSRSRRRGLEMLAGQTSRRGVRSGWRRNLPALEADRIARLHGRRRSWPMRQPPGAKRLAPCGGPDEPRPEQSAVRRARDVTRAKGSGSPATRGGPRRRRSASRGRLGDVHDARSLRTVRP